MILSWLQNHLETRGGRAAWSWHFSCVQTVVKLQLHSVLATLYLLAEEHLFSISWLPDWEMWEGSLAAFAEVASVPSFSKWICSQPLISSLSCLATGHGKGTIAFLVFLCLKTRLLLTCASSSTDFFFSSSFSKVGWFTKSSERLHYTQFIVQRGGKKVRWMSMKEISPVSFGGEAERLGMVSMHSRCLPWLPDNTWSLQRWVRESAP